MHGLSIYSSGDEDSIDATFCASVLCARSFAPHEALAKFFRSLPFFDEPIDAVPCGVFVGGELIEDASEGALLWLAVSPFPNILVASFYAIFIRHKNELTY